MTPEGVPIKIYKKAVTRNASLFDVNAWYEGESRELEKYIGVGFFNHLFVSKENRVTLYYDIEEGDKFWEIIEEILTDDFFNDLCDGFFSIIENPSPDNDKEIYDLIVKIRPALAIFDEISKYPEYLATPEILRRLMRVRISTESFSYDIAKKVKQKNLPKTYIFHKGEVFFQQLDQFTKENNIIIENE